MKHPTASGIFYCISAATLLSGSSEESAAQARERRRQQEFDERTGIPAQELLAKLRAVVEEANEVIRGLDANALLSRRQIQDDDVTVLEAVYHVVEHFSMHTGQIIALTKARRGEDLNLWRPARETTSGRP